MISNRYKFANTGPRLGPGRQCHESESPSDPSPGRCRMHGFMTPVTPNLPVNTAASETVAARTMMPPGSLVRVSTAVTRDLNSRACETGPPAGPRSICLPWCSDSEEARNGTRVCTSTKPSGPAFHRHRHSISPRRPLSRSAPAASSPRRHSAAGPGLLPPADSDPRTQTLGPRGRGPGAEQGHPAGRKQPRKQPRRRRVVGGSVGYGAGAGILGRRGAAQSRPAAPAGRRAGEARPGITPAARPLCCITVGRTVDYPCCRRSRAGPGRAELRISRSSSPAGPGTGTPPSPAR